MPRVGLTPDRVVAEASILADELADGSGVERLTLAAVAQRLDVALPSLYKHVRGVDDLRRRMAVVALREIHEAVIRATVGRSGAVALRGLAEIKIHRS